MFGFVFGVVCLGLLFVALRRRHYGYAGIGPFCGFGAAPGYYRGPWHGPPRRSCYRHPIARSLLIRLDTTPGQEKAIRSTLQGLLHNLREARQDLQEIGGDLAQALGGDVLDEQALAAALEKQDVFVTRARSEVVQAIRSVHATLNGTQRRQLAEWIADAPSFRDLRGARWL